MQLVVDFILAQINHILSKITVWNFSFHAVFFVLRCQILFSTMFGSEWRTIWKKNDG